VKIPLRYIEQYRFRFGELGRGTGQGPGNVGDAITPESQSGEGSERPGNEPGGEMYEAEISVEELTRMMVEDLALPWLEDKEGQQITTISYNFDDVRRKGSMASLDKERTSLENLKRHAAHKQPQVGAFDDADLRFKVWSVREEYHSNAAVYLLMDRSGSMTTEKKYIAKSFFFWLVRCLKLKYQTADVSQALQMFLARKEGVGIAPELGNAALRTE
jgi:uncharacterized protein